MSPHASPGKSDDLFERIAQLLDPSQRAYFYERMVYFRHLPPDDELLRLVEAIGFLAVIICAAPEAVATERAQITSALATSLATLQAVADRSAAYHRDLDTRLSILPAAIAEGIHPPAIAQAIAEHLRQQVAQTGLPVTANALALTAQELSEALAVAQQTVRSLGPWTQAATEARHSVEQVRTTVAQTAAEARATVTRLQAQFTADYRHALSLLCVAALVLGVFLGIEVQQWRDARASAVPPVTVSGRLAAPPPEGDGSVVDHRWNSDVTASHATAPTP